MIFNKDLAEYTVEFGKSHHVDYIEARLINNLLRMMQNIYAIGKDGKQINGGKFLLRP